MYVATAHCLRASVHGLLAILPFKERVSPKVLPRLQTQTYCTGDKP